MKNFRSKVVLGMILLGVLVPNFVKAINSTDYAVTHNTLPSIAFLQANGEERNILRPGQTVKIIGSNLTSTHTFYLQNDSQIKNPSVSIQSSESGEFVVPALPTGSYYVYFKTPDSKSNKVTVKIISSEPDATTVKKELVPTLIKPTIQAFTQAERDEKARQIQTLIMQLLIQLIELLKQQQATSN